MSDESEKLPYPGAMKATDALRELLHVVVPEDLETRKQALMGWWRRWTSTACATSAIDAETLSRFLGAKDKLLTSHRDTRIATIANLIGATPGVLHERSNENRIDNVTIHASCINVILIEPNPRAVPAAPVPPLGKLM